MVEIRESYDAVIIGAGMGGLTCGAILAKSGLKVLIVERNSKPGGSCASFQQNGYSFDNGLCYLLGCEPGGVIYQTLEELGIRQNIQFVKMEPALRLMGSGYDLRISSPESLEELIKIFPSEAKAIRKFAAECRATAAEVEKFAVKSLDLMNIWEKVSFLTTMVFRSRRLMKYMTKSWQDVVASFFKNPKLRAIVLSTYPYNGLDVMAGVMMSLGTMDRLNYPKGGFQALANVMVNGLERYGGDLALNTMVSKILIEGNKAIGVQLSDGRQVKARYVVSNVDARQTFLKLIGEEHIGPKLKKSLNETKLSPPAFLVSLGVNLNLRAMGFGNGYTIYNPSNDISELFGTDPQKCILSIIKHSNLDPSQAPENATAVELYVALPYNYVKDWDVEKESIAKKVISSAEKVIPGLSRHIVCKHIMSPLDFERSTLNSHGAAMGWQMTPGGRPRSQKTPIRNLFQAGQWTSPGGGVSIVMTSGRNAAQLVLKSKQQM